MAMELGSPFRGRVHQFVASALLPSPGSVLINMRPCIIHSAMPSISFEGKQSTILPGLKDIINPMQYKVWLLDQFGVLHDGQKPYPGAAETLTKIASFGATLVVLSNSSRRAASTVERMKQLGFDPSMFAGVITSGELTHRYLLRRQDPWFAALGQRCIHITWSERSSISLQGLGLVIVEKPDIADFVLIHGTEALGLVDGNVKPATLEEIEGVLALAVSRGLPMVVANPDHVTVEARDLQIMPGTLGVKYEQLGGQVRYMGKPDSVIYQAAAELTGVETAHMIAVGDSLFHDIQGATKNGIDSIFVAGGIHANQLGIADIGDQPELEKLENLFQVEKIYPSYVVPLFTW